VSILISLLSGIRIGELCALTWSDVNLESRTISVSKTIQRIYVKDRDGRCSSKVLVDTPKTNSSVRVVPISSLLMGYMERIRSDGEKYVVTGTYEYLEPRTYRTYYNRFLRRNGISHVNFHGLRHTFATRCIEAGGDCKTISELLGHASVNMTLNLYVHPRMDQKRRCVEMMCGHPPGGRRPPSQIPAVTAPSRYQTREEIFFPRLTDGIWHDTRGLTDTESQVYELICGRSVSTASDMSEIMGTSDKTVRRTVKKLTEKGYIRRIGGNRGGRWVPAP
jgi:DNA-binding transcriptional ArsR family regulator